MGWPILENREEYGEEVVVLRGDYTPKYRGRGVWAALITGTDPEHGYARKFIGSRRVTSVERQSALTSERWEEMHIVIRPEMVQDGDLVELNGGYRSGKHGFYYAERRSVTFYEDDDDDDCKTRERIRLIRLTDEQFRQRLGERISVANKPRRVFRL